MLSVLLCASVWAADPYAALMKDSRGVSKSTLPRAKP